MQSTSNTQYRQVVAWKEGFDALISHFQTAKVTNGSIGCMDYEKAMSGLSSGTNKNIVRPSDSDLVADVEIAARRALSNDTFLLDRFFTVFVRQEEEPDYAMWDIDAIRLIVGRELDQRHISPLALYLKPMTVDRSLNRK